MRRSNRRGCRSTRSTSSKVVPILLLGLLFLVSFVYDRNESRSSILYSGRSSSIHNNYAFHNHSSSNSSVLHVESIKNATTNKNETTTTRDEELLHAPFRPVQALRKYIEQHSHQALLSELTSSSSNNNSSSNITINAQANSRKYAVAYYWCPQRAGNIFHSFFHTVVWSMIHNRTVLWMYHNTKNEEEDCRAVLERAPWMPSYLEWKEKLPALKDEPVVPVSLSMKTATEDQAHAVVLYPQIPDVLSQDKSITRISWSSHPLQQQKFQDYITQRLSTYHQNITMELYSEGMEFLYGMLYAQIFQLQRPTASTIIVGNNDGDSSDDHNGADDTTFSLALHSRHTVGADDGSFVPHEKECLERLLDKGRAGHDDSDGGDSSFSCRVHLMSDRPKTISLLTTWLTTTEQNCSVVIAKHDSGDGPVQEHGPWAGAGYLEDLDVTARARHGIIGDPHRSSTALLIDLMEYRRRIYMWKSTSTAGTTYFSDDPVEDLKLCKLSEKRVTGYNYGPGTPTFRHHSYLEPLAPVRIVDKYIHDDGSSEAKRHHGIILISIDFERPTVKGVYTALNSFLYAIVNDMDIRWKTDQDLSSICDNGGGSLRPRAGTKGFEAGNQTAVGDISIVEISSFEDMLAIRGETSEDQTGLKDDLIVMLQETEIMLKQDDITEWQANVADTSGDSATKLLSDLFVHGSELLFGLLFHEFLSHCPYPDIEGESASSSAVLQLEYAAANEADSVRNCIETIFFPNTEDQAIGGVSFQDDTCHIFILSDQASIEETVLASIVLTSESEPPRLMLRTDRFCSFSFYSMTSTVHGDSNNAVYELSPLFWKEVEEASVARAGWIRSKEEESSSRAHEVFSAGVTLTRERLEMKRHLETWKQGREPFLIDKLPECLY